MLLRLSIKKVGKSGEANPPEQKRFYKLKDQSRQILSVEETCTLRMTMLNESCCF